MELISKLESGVASWYKNMPHMSANGQKWLGDNLWWIALVGLVLGILSIISLLGVTLLAGIFLTAWGGAVGAAIGGIALIAALVVLGVSIVQIVITGLAISPLKNHQKRGWNLLFIVLLIEAVSLVLALFLQFELFSFVWGALFVAAAGYFLFEARDQFASEKPIHKTKTSKTAASKTA